MCLVPVLRRLGVDLQGHRELQIRMRGVGHHLAHHFDRRRDLGIRRLENKFVVDLQKRFRRKLRLLQRRAHAGDTFASRGAIRSRDLAQADKWVKVYFSARVVIKNMSFRLCGVF